MMTPSPHSKLDRQTSPFDPSSDVGISANSLNNCCLGSSPNSAGNVSSPSVDHRNLRRQHMKKNSSSSISENYDEGSFEIVDNKLVPSADSFDDDRFLSDRHRSRRSSAGSGRATAACIQMSKLTKTPVRKMFDYRKHQRRDNRKQTSQLRDHSKQRKRNKKKDGVPLTIDVDFTLKKHTKKISRAFSGVSTAFSIPRLEDEYYSNHSYSEESIEKKPSPSPIPDFHKARNMAHRTAFDAASRAIQLGKNLSSSWHDNKSANSPAPNQLQGGFRRVATSLTAEENTSKTTYSHFLEINKEIALAESDGAESDISDVISDVSNFSLQTSSLPSTPIHPDLSRESSVTPPPPTAREVEEEDSKPVNVKKRISQFECYNKVGKALASGFQGPVTPRRRGRPSKAPPQVASPPPSMFPTSLDQKGPRSLFRPDEDIFSPASEKEPFEDCNDTLKVIFLGSPGGGKSSIARGLSGSKKRKRSRDKVHVNIYDLEQTQATTGRKIKLNLWDLQGGTEKRSRSHHTASPPGSIPRSHYATQSLFFSPNSLYILVWDMAVNNPQANDHCDETLSASSCSDESGYETDEDMDRVKKDRVILRDIDEHIMFWIHAIAERKCSGCAVMPVVTFSDMLDDREVHHRCDLLMRQLKQYRPKGHIYPRIMIGTTNEIPVLSPNTPGGLDQLRHNLVEITKEDPIESLSIFRSHFDSKFSPVTLSVRNVISTFAQDGYELLHFEQIYVKMSLDPPLAEHFTQHLVREALTFLHSTGFILFFGNPSSRVIDDLSEFIILDPKWLSKAISQTLRDDWRQALIENRHSSIDTITDDERSIASSVMTKLDCPIMTSDQTVLLWKNTSCISAQFEKLPGNYADSLCDFLQSLCKHIGIFLSVDIGDTKLDSYLLPSMAGNISPDFWTYKAKDDWKTTLANAWHLTKTPPCDFFDQVSVAVFEELTKMHLQSEVGGAYIREPEIMYWKRAMYASVVEEMPMGNRNDVTKAEFFVTLVYPDSSMCVGTHKMRGNDLKLIVASKGYLGKSGEKIWRLGYSAILDAIEAIVENIGESEGKETCCPNCLLSTDPSNAYVWDSDYLAAHRNEPIIRCSRHSSVDTKLLLGPEEEDFDDNSTVATGLASAYTVRTNGTFMTTGSVMTSGTTRSTFEQLSPSIVIVGHWDAVKNEILNVGSGFVADAKKGLIVTAGHIFYNLQIDQKISPKIGKAYKNNKNEKGRIQAVIGVLNPNPNPTNTASFKYIAEIITHCTSDADACILRLTHKFEAPADVVDGKKLPLQPELSFSGPSNQIKSERLSKLSLTSKVEVETKIRVYGYNQCGEGGLYEPGQVVHQTLAGTQGYVNTILGKSHRPKAGVTGSDNFFVPQDEIVVICPTKIGNSGGPCVNEDGKVIGIVSRTDPIDPATCYLAPASLIKKLLKKAKEKCDQPLRWQQESIRYYQ